MFLDYLKNFVIKKIVNKSLSVNAVQTDVHKIENVGIVVDQQFLSQVDNLINRLIECGVLKQNIEIVVRTSQTNGDISENYTRFAASTISATGSFLDPKMQKFVDTDFDLLINYYDQEKPVLMLVSSLSKANFKAGFASVDKRINHLIIDATAQEYSIFEKELFKYLKILNAI